MILHPIKSSIKISEWIRYECHPWRLDPGSPCRDDGLVVFSVYKICVDQYFSLFTLRYRSGFATLTETFKGFNRFLNVSNGVANPVTLQFSSLRIRGSGFVLEDLRGFNQGGGAMTNFTGINTFNDLPQFRDALPDHCFLRFANLAVILV